jgi:hypothetical protein
LMRMLTSRICLVRLRGKRGWRIAAKTIAVFFFLRRST